jgi:type II secretory pathway predicted ATPase ExeA
VFESHFGLKFPPFSETVDPSTYVAVPSRDAALRRLRYALEHSQGPAVLFGPPGSGKTLVARRLASERAGPVIHLTFPALTASELVGHLALELGGLPSPPATLHAALSQVRTHLSALAARGQNPLLIVDDAHLIESPATFEALKLLLNFASQGPADLSLLFVGDTEVLLEIPPGLTDRLAATCLLGPLSASESCQYVRGRLAAAGSTASLFSDDALSALHHAADGLPRRLNRLADMALLIAYAQDRATADSAIVALAAREFQRNIAA